MPYEAQPWGFDPDSDPGGAERAAAGIAWLRARWGEETSCPYCGGTHWAVTGTFRLIRHTIQGRPGGSEPSFEAICRGCGNTVFIDGSVVNAAGS